MHVLESVLYAENLIAVRHFYVEILELPEISFDPERSLFLKCDSSVLIVFRASKTRISGAGVPPHGTDGYGHLAFSAAAEEIQTWRERLNASGIPIIDEIHWGNGAHSIYFNDPAGNILEFATPNLWGF